MKSSNGKKYIIGPSNQASQRGSLPARGMTNTSSMNKQSATKRNTAGVTKGIGSKGAAASSYFLNTSGSTYSLHSRPGGTRAQGAANYDRSSMT